MASAYSAVSGPSTSHLVAKPGAGLDQLVVVQPLDPDFGDPAVDQLVGIEQPKHARIGGGGAPAERNADRPCDARLALLAAAPRSDRPDSAGGRSAAGLAGMGDLVREHRLAGLPVEIARDQDVGPQRGSGRSQRIEHPVGAGPFPRSGAPACAPCAL